MLEHGVHDVAARRPTVVVVGRLGPRALAAQRLAPAVAVADLVGQMNVDEVDDTDDRSEKLGLTCGPSRVEWLAEVPQGILKRNKRRPRGRMSFKQLVRGKRAC